MKKILYFLLFMPLIILTGCNDDEDNNSKNKVLMLKVDYQTYEFEGGIEYTFDQKTDSFTINFDYIYYTDPELITLSYSELNETLFSGTVIWNGEGEVITPLTINPPDFFETVSGNDTVYPSRGFTQVYHTFYHENIDYSKAWMSIQKLEKVRQFLRSNPNQHVKIFVYSPSGAGNSNVNSDYYIFLQN